MNWKVSVPLVFAWLSLLPAATQAVLVIDQSQPVEQTIAAGATGFASPEVRPTQSFAQTNDNIAGAGFFLTQGGLGTFTISVRELPFAGGGAVLASASSTINAFPGSWIDLFWAPVAIAPGSTYYLELFGPRAPRVGGTLENLYGRGNYVVGTTGFQIPGLDLTFRTYAEVKETVPVAEPAVLVLLGLGLAGLGLSRRLQAAQALRSR